MTGYAKYLCTYSSIECMLLGAQSKCSSDGGGRRRGNDGGVPGGAAQSMLSMWPK